MSHKNSTLHDTRFKVRRVANQVMAIGANTCIFDTIDFDNKGEFSLVTNLFTARTSGFYLFTSSVEWTTVLGGTNDLRTVLQAPQPLAINADSILETGIVTTVYNNVCGLTYLTVGQQMRVSCANIGIGNRNSAIAHLQGFKIR